MDDQIAQLTADLEWRLPPAPELLQQVQEQLRVTFPPDYAAFMQASDGATGWIGPTYVDFWSCEEMLERNAALAIDEFMPEVCLIGSDGGGEAFALDRRTAPHDFLEVPFTSIHIEEAWFGGHNFLEFLQFLQAQDTEVELDP